MKEFQAKFLDGLLHGLRKEPNNPTMSQALVECYNLRPREFGLRPVADMTDPLELAVTWPWPQLLVGMKHRVVATSTGILTASDVWDLTLRLTLTSGGLWDLADFGDYLLMADGAGRMAQRMGDTGTWSSFTSSTNIPSLKSVCAFRGQIIGGGVLSSWNGCGPNYVIWSDIGSASFTPGMSNEAGFAIVPWNGEVQRVLPKQDGIVVYATNGIMMLHPAEQIFGMARLANVGIPCKGAVAGDLNEHVFVDTQGVLWRLAGAGPERLGYQEYMAELDASSLVISYNPGEREYYITDGSVGFLLTAQGLCRTYQMPTSVAFLDGTLWGPGNFATDQRALVTTDVLDFGLRALKTAAVLEFGVRTTANVLGAVDWRLDYKQPLQRSLWLQTNPMGWIMPVVTAEEFRLCFQASAYDDVELDYMTVRLKLVDKRSIRGGLRCYLD